MFTSKNARHFYYCAGRSPSPISPLSHVNIHNKRPSDGSASVPLEPLPHRAALLEPLTQTTEKGSRGAPKRRDSAISHVLITSSPAGNSPPDPGLTPDEVVGWRSLTAHWGRSGFLKGGLTGRLWGAVWAASRGVWRLWEAGGYCSCPTWAPVRAPHVLQTLAVVHEKHVKTLESPKPFITDCADDPGERYGMDVPLCGFKFPWEWGDFRARRMKVEVARQKRRPLRTAVGCNFCLKSETLSVFCTASTGWTQLYPPRGGSSGHGRVLRFGPPWPTRGPLCSGVPGTNQRRAELVQCNGKEAFDCDVCTISRVFSRLGWIREAMQIQIRGHDTDITPMSRPFCNRPDALIDFSSESLLLYDL